MELESYRLASRQREFQVRGMNFGTDVGPTPEECDGRERQQDDELAQVKGLLAKVVSYQGYVPP